MKKPCFSIYFCIKQGCLKKTTAWPMLILLFILQSCMSEIKPKDVKVSVTSVKTSGYTGCTLATGLSMSTIKVTFDFPTNASEISVYRDGTNILTTKNRLSTSFVDINLVEGQSYHYECLATIDGQVTIGDKSVDGTTLALHAPVFSGIESVTAISPHSVKVTWPATSGGAIAHEFRIYGAMNASVNFSSFNAK